MIEAREIVNKEYTQRHRTATTANPRPYVYPIFFIISALGTTEIGV